MKTVKVIISLVLIIALISSFICTPAYAVTPEAAIAAGGLAGLIAALMGLDIAYNNFDVTDLTNFFNDHAPDSPDYLSFVADVIHNPTGTISMFINKEFFKYLRLMNSDIIDDYNIQPNTVNNIETYSGWNFGDWIFPNQTSTTYYGLVGSANLTGQSSVNVGDSFLSVSFSNLTPAGNNVVNGDSFSYVMNELVHSYTNHNMTANSQYVYGVVRKSDHKIGIKYNSNPSDAPTTAYWSTYSAEYITKGTIIVAGTIDETIGDDLPTEGGVTITAPDPGDIIDINQLIEYLKQLMLDSPDDLVTELVQEEPDPDVGPSIADTPFIDLIGLFRNLGNKIEDIVQDVIGLSGTLTNTIEEGFSDVIGLFEDVGDTITDIYDTVVEKVGSIDLSLDSILEAVQSIAQSIETAAVDLFSDFLSAIQSIFAPILGRIRGALGIWHYVVEWLNCIGGVFTWIFGLCSGTAYCMVVPIYASIAAAICIALYKRFGR